MNVPVAFAPAEVAAARIGILIDVLRAAFTIAACYQRVLCVPGSAAGIVA